LLRFALMNFDHVRVVTAGTRFVGYDVVVASHGLKLRKDTSREAVIPWQPPQERLVSWTEIESIQVRRGASGVGPLAGAVAGFAIGSVIMIADATAHAYTFGGSTHTSGKPIVLGILVGATLGVLLDRPGRWQTVYP
jgi:hypothetical protein